MVRPASVALALLALASLPLAAQSPRDLIFPTGLTCYARDYDLAHLARHPVQQVTSIALTPAPRSSGEPLFPLWVIVTHRDQSGKLEARASCENIEDRLYCGMEGDAGAFSIAPARNGSVLLTVSSLGMSFEGETGFVTLRADRGDDRSFLLHPVRDCR
jgi:hypothetical protein